MATRRRGRSGGLSAEKQGDVGPREASVEVESEEARLQTHDSLANLISDLREARLKDPEGVLQELGIEDASDFKYFHADDLRETKLRPVERRKFLNCALPYQGSDESVRSTRSIDDQSETRPKPSFEPYNGAQKNWDQWKRATIASFGMVHPVYREAMENEDGDENPLDEEQNSYLYTVLEHQLARGTARSRIAQFKRYRDGIRAW
eukprot:6072421-Prorocentrum_lima.AAC.1